jgi:hypothetical protein
MAVSEKGVGIKEGCWAVSQSRQLKHYPMLACLDLLLLLIVKAQVPPAIGIYFWSSLVWFSWYWYAKSFSKATQKKVLLS